MRLTLATASNALYVLLVQVLALVTLAPTAFGLFSIQYLLFAFASSISLSLISEAWIRADAGGAGLAPWAEYSSASLYLAACAGIVTLCVSLLFEPLRIVAWIGALAVTASTYRGAARYYSVRKGEARGALPGDVAGVVVSAVVWTMFFSSGARDLTMIVTMWAAGALMSAIVSKTPRILLPHTVVDWLNAHRAQIRVLIGDSLMSNVSSIGTPYVLAPMLGLNDFGVYRAISNVAAPVRLALTPLAPRLAGIPIERHRNSTRIMLMILGSLFFGLAAYFALIGIGVLALELGVLSAVVEFAIPAGIFVAANFLGHYLSIIARAHLGGHRLLVGRAWHTCFGIVGPIVGALTWGLTGAIWGYTASIVAACAIWLILVLRRTS